MSWAQNSGLKNGLGIHIGGDVTFNHGNSAMDNKTDVLYYYVPGKTYYGATAGLSYRQFISATRFFAEADLSAYYLGQKSVDGIHLGTILDEYDNFLVNDDMDEWGEYEIEASGTVTLQDGFKVEKGATFAIYPSSYK